jgi:AraC-like DNA-binding protein
MKPEEVSPAAACIGRALALVERDLGSDIGVRDLAGAAGYSLFHFIRVFRQATGYSPYDYLMRRRLTRGFEMLRDTRRRVIDVALDVGFQAPEAFARAFRRMFGLLPREARGLASVPRSSLRMPLEQGYLNYRCSEAPAAPCRTTAAERHVVGVMGPLDDAMDRMAAAVCRAVRGGAATAVLFPDHPVDGPPRALVGAGFPRSQDILEAHVPRCPALSFLCAANAVRLRYALEDALVVRQLRMGAASYGPQIVIDLGEVCPKRGTTWQVLLPYRETPEDWWAEERLTTGDVP